MRVLANWFLITAALLLTAAVAHADGGSIQLSKIIGNYEITILTSPNPLRAGPVDISVLVQETGPTKPTADVNVTLHVAPVAHPDEEVLYPATREAATNKLMHAAKFELPAAGRWQVMVVIDGPQGQARTQLEIDALEPLPRWQELWLWIALPVIPIVLYSVHQLLVRRPKVG